MLGKDREIIRRLMEDPRTSFSKIARDLGISSESIRQRVKQMRREGKLKFYCVANGRLFDKRRITMILSVPLHEKTLVIEKLKALPTTLEIHSGVLKEAVILDIISQDLDKDTHELLKNLEKLGVEVKEMFESELVHFDPTGILD
ncbi:MAG: AsnC family transcriptional regulator [Candidatus Hydrothermarchaeales archaeon]